MFRLAGCLALSALLVGTANAEILTPGDIPGLRVWLDAQDPSGDGLLPADGTPLGVWVDKSGLGNHATQAVASRQPLFRTNQHFGLPAVKFDGHEAEPVGTSDWLDVPDVFNLNSVTAFLVGRSHPWTRGYFISSRYTHRFYIWHEGSGNEFRYRIGGGTSYDAAYRPGDSEVHLFSLQNNGLTNGAQAFLDGTSVGTGTKYQYESVRWLTLGAHPGLSAHEGFLRCEVMEVLFYDRALNGPERMDVEEYLHEKWIAPDGDKYADWTLTAHGRGVGTFEGSHDMPDFTFDVVRPNVGFSMSVESGDDFDCVPWESRFGEGNGQESLRLRSLREESPLTPAITTLTINFESPTPSGWAFAVTDLETEDAVIGASFDGSPIPDARVAGWFRGLFDSMGGVYNLPSGFDAANVAVVAQKDADGLLSNEAVGFGGTESASAWFAPDTPIDTLTITHRNRYGGGGLGGYASMHVYLAVPEPSTLILLAVGALGLVGYGWRRARIGRKAAR